MAKRNISNLNIEVTSSAEGIQAGMRRATSGLDTFASRVATLSHGMNIARIAVDGLRAAWNAMSAVAGKVMEQFAPLDAMQKMADNLGTTQENLAALEIAGGRAGASLAELNTAMIALTRRTGDAADGTGEAADAFDQLGLVVDDLLDLDAVRRFEEVSRAMQNVGTQAERAAIANALFGRTGVRLLNTMQAVGEQGLDPFIQRANELGVVLSREQLAGIEAFNDAWFDMQLALRGIFTQLAGAAGQDMADFVNQTLVPGAKVLVDWAQALNDMNKELELFKSVLTAIAETWRISPFGRLQSMVTPLANARFYSTQTQTLSPALRDDPVGQLLREQNEKTEKTNTLLQDMARSLTRAYTQGMVDVTELVVPSAG